MRHTTTIACLMALSSGIYGIDIDVNSVGGSLAPTSIKDAASTIAKNVISYYHGNETGHTIGVLDAPYFWWEAGSMWSTLLKYQKLTGDTQYSSLISQGLVSQIGDNNDFMPKNWTNTEGNDDQATWALASISAAEANFPAVPGAPSWVSLASEVFNEQVARWDESSCGGGLRWQIYPFLTGYDYKNSISTGLFFQLSSRLARYTGNTTYSEWATKSYQWVNGSGFIHDFNIYDGAKTTGDCKIVNKVQFSYVAGTYIAGAAYMYNITNGGATWKSTLDGLLNTTLTTFFPDGVAKEIACETRGTCNVDMHAFKGILISNLVDTIAVAPYTASSILPILKSTASAAGKACDGKRCALEWSGKELNSSSNIGNELSALNAVQGLLFGQNSIAKAESGSASSDGSTATASGAPSSTVAGVGASSATGTSKPSAGNTVGVGMGLLCVVFGSMVMML